MGGVSEREVYTAAEHISIYRYELLAGGESLKMRENGAEVEDEEEADIKEEKKGQSLLSDFWRLCFLWAAGYLSQGDLI